MGKVIPRSAAIERIREAAAKTLAAARAFGGEIQTLTEARVGQLVVALDDLEHRLNQARSADDTVHASLMARDSESDLTIRAVCDEIWNAMGRPAQSAEYDLIVGSGTKAWTDGDPTKQPSLMAVLASNIRTSKHPKLADRKEDWAKRIEEKAAAQAEAIKPTDAAYAQVTVLGMQRRAFADSIQIGLTRLKRDLKNNGMTEAQVHEIIPDAPTGSNGTAPAPTPPQAA